MVLTRRQHKAISRWLPNEIISQIILAAPTADRAALCRASKLFHGIGVLVLYRVVNMHSPVSIDAFSRTILSNSSLAPMVRSLSAHRHQWSDFKLITTMLTSFGLLLHLEHLVISVVLWQEEHRHAFLQWSFPRLVSCHLGLSTVVGTVPPIVSSFLRRHSSLKSVSSPWGGSIQADPSAPLPLPHLRNFRGPADVIPLISGARDLEEVSLSWGDKQSGQDAEKIIRILKSMTRDDIPFICSNNHCYVFVVELLDSISRNLPQTKTLQMRAYRFDKEILAHLKNYLPRFASLLFLSVTTYFDHTWLNDGEVRNIFHDIVDACPSLKACRFNTYAWRKANATWEEYPAEDFPDLAARIHVYLAARTTSFFLESFVRKIHCAYFLPQRIYQECTSSTTTSDTPSVL
ncbi:hypothetical protein B0H19DRAFT_1110379 [Mycena capillaripes]|nr:hypothetical protein B0H19DRAFT_1110379 [Mycena capillaripes]